MAKISKDLSVGNLHPRESLFLTGNLGSLNAEIIVQADGAASLALDLRGTFSLTIEVAGTVDGTNWTIIPVRPQSAGAMQYVAAVAGATAGVWVGKCAPFRQIRARCTAYTSGAATAVLLSDTAPLDDSLQANVTPLLVTATGASGAAVTLTLPAPGQNLRQYLTYLSINRYAAAVLTASATPVVVTTTNLPGALAFSFEADAAALGTMIRWREDFAYPLVASAQNTAVTIVCPVTTGVIWRVTSGYYVAP
jgi:hypothetical protein